MARSLIELIEIPQGSEGHNWPLHAGAPAHQSDGQPLAYGALAAQQPQWVVDRGRTP